MNSKKGGYMIHPLGNYQVSYSRSTYCFLPFAL